jgi:hypothetical protein
MGRLRADVEAEVLAGAELARLVVMRVAAGRAAELASDSCLLKPDNHLSSSKRLSLGYVYE